MSRLFDKQDKLTITNYLRLAQHSKFNIDLPDGTTRERTAADFNRLFEAGDSVDVFPSVLEYYVDSVTGSSGFEGTPDRPKATIDQAINLCTDATKFYKIHVAPGHSEAGTTAAFIDVDVDNVEIIGYGYGDDQAKVTFGNAVATLAINADNVIIRNMHFQATVTAVAKGIDIEDGADDYAIIGCRFTAETLGTDEFEDAIFVTTADRGVIAGNYFDMDEAGAASAIHIVGACLGCNIIGNYIVGDYSVGCIEGVTAAAEQVLIRQNTLVNGVHSGLNAVACISLYTGTTGMIEDNRLYTAVASPITGAIVADGCFLGGGNTISTTAETIPLSAESGLHVGPVYSTSKAGIADETDETVLWDVTGTVAVHGVQLAVETAVNSEVTIGVEADGNGIDLIATTDVDELTAVGDTQTAAQAGGAGVETEVPGDLTPLWNSPAIVTAGAIVLAVGGTPGAGVFDGTIFWSKVSPDGNVAVE